MFKRSINQELIRWSGNSNRKPLILRGARQIGKTTSVSMLGQHYDTFLQLNLELKKDHDLFLQDYEIDELINAIHFHLNTPVNSSGRSLLFIDEIQYAPQAANMLRYFFEKRKDIDVIAAGSMLETLIDRHISFPVGRVEYLFMYPMTFQEFLAAAKEEEALSALTELPCPNYAHKKLLKLFHSYTLVGGMPEAVAAYLENKDILACNKVYQDLMTSFLDDVEKYARNRSVAQIIRHTISQAPLNAGSRIQFQGFGNSNYKSREIGEALRTLEKAMLLKLIYPTTESQLPGELNFKKSPRLSFLDTGFINHAANLQQYYFDLDDLSHLFKGRIIENIVGQELLATNPLLNQQLKFWVREKSQSNAEVDYVIPFKNYLIPVEVKSGKTGTLKSLMQFMEQAPHSYAIRFYAGPIQKDTLSTPSGKPFTLLNLPYYLVCHVNAYLEELTAGVFSP